MRALLVSEGKHEEGGALESLVRRTATVPLEFTFRRANDARVRTHRGKGAGMFKRALAWMREAREPDMMNSLACNIVFLAGCAASK
jgi:hypothetical protein